MTEIKSTMDLVMERAARFGKATDKEIREEEARKKGMRLSAEYLNGSINSLSETLVKEAVESQMICRKGMAEGLLRNIALPRDDFQHQRSSMALQGIVDIGGSAGDLVSICKEINHILGQYNQHRDQLRSQLEEQIKMQYEQILAQQGGANLQGLSIDPTMQPRFKEEWSRIESELNSQYNRALDERKNLLAERF